MVGRNSQWLSNFHLPQFSTKTMQSLEAQKMSKGLLVEILTVTETCEMIAENLSNDNCIHHFVTAATNATGQSLIKNNGWPEPSLLDRSPKTSVDTRKRS